MFTEKHFPNAPVTGEALDAYLEKGWYRLGQAIFTTYFLMFDAKLFSPIWVRLPLEGYHFRKSLRKILNRNESAFRTLIRPGFIDDEKEAIFQKFRTGFKGDLSPTLADALLDNQAINFYSTYEVAVYDADRLVAFSFFDLGKQSLASIKGVYDPEYGSFSLGIYTMLREIQYGLEQGYRFFYPGYIVPGNPRFDYKLRIGTKEEVCFFDSQQAEWRPFVHFSNEKIPVYALSSQLIQIGEALASAKINSQMLYFSNFEKAFSDETRFPGAPLFLHCYADLFPKPRFIVYYDWLQQQYVFCHGLRKEEIFQYLSFDHHEAGAFVSPLMVSEKSVIIESSQMEEIVAWVRLFRELVQPPAKRTWL